MTDANKLEISIEAHVATVVLNRPKAHNALDVEILDRLPGILQALSDDEAVRCVVVTGAGDRAFCAGGDISGVGGADIPDPEGLVDRLEAWSQASVLLHEMPKPTLAAVNGIAAGAGMSLALACDLRVASPAARFVTSFARLAMSGDFGGSYFLPRIVGSAKARELYFLSAPVDSDEALELGLVNWRVEASELHTRTRAIAEQLSRLPRLTYQNMKRNLDASTHRSLREVVRIEAEGMIETAQSARTRAAAAAFFEKA